MIYSIIMFVFLVIWDMASLFFLRFFLDPSLDSYFFIITFLIWDKTTRKRKTEATCKGCVLLLMPHVMGWLHVAAAARQTDWILIRPKGKATEFVTFLCSNITERNSPCLFAANVLFIRIQSYHTYVLGDPEDTANLYCNFGYPYWEGCLICSIYLR